MAKSKNKDECQEFVEQHFKGSIKEFEKSGLDENCPELTLYEKVLIYEYSMSQYEGLNEALKEAKTTDYQQTFMKLLNKTLSKLPDYKGLVYRGANLTEKQIQEFKELISKDKPYFETTFCSTSRSKSIAKQFGSVQFLIFSKTGKRIEEIAKFGTGHPQNEKEVLFKTDTAFEVVSVTKVSGNMFEIKLEEL